MKSIGVRALRENPGILSQSAADGELVVITNRNKPSSISVPFDDVLLESGIHVSLAISAFKTGVLTLVKSARLAKMPVESFLEKLSLLGIEVVDQSATELDADLAALDD